MEGIEKKKTVVHNTDNKLGWEVSFFHLLFVRHRNTKSECIMKTFSMGKLLKTGIYTICFLASIGSLKAQSGDSTILKLSLYDAIRSAKESNKLVGVLRTEESATKLDLEDSKWAPCPAFTVMHPFSVIPK